MSYTEIKSDALTAKINSFGAELSSVKRGDREYIWQADPNVWEKHSPVLFPIVSSLRNDKYTYNGKEYTMYQHGFASSCEFEVEKKSENSVTFLLKSNDETKKQYPFDFEFRVVYTLSGSDLKTDFIVDNKTDGAMYWSAGAHEGYACPGGYKNYSIVFDEEETISAQDLDPEEGLLADTTTPILCGEREIKLCDDHFKIDALIFLNYKSKGVSLRDDRTGESIHVNLGNMNTLLVWTRVGSEFLCIEPWSGITDFAKHPVSDFSEKIRINKLEKGESATLTHTVTFF